MSRFASRLAAGLDRVDSHAAEPIVYSRPSTGEEIDLQATPGVSDFDAFDAEGFPIVAKSKDWLFPAADLKLDGTNVVEPAEGDVVRWTDAAETTHVFRVLPFGGDRELWRYSDAAQRRLRVHTKEMDTE